jgi:hypothetical protein
MLQDHATWTERACAHAVHMHQGVSILQSVLGLQDAANRGSIQSVQVKGPSTGWQDLNNAWGASWETGQVPEGPLDLHIYDDIGVDVSFLPLSLDTNPSCASSLLGDWPGP